MLETEKDHRHKFSWKDRASNVYGIIHILMDVLDGYCMEFDYYAENAGLTLTHENKKLVNSARSHAKAMRSIYKQFTKKIIENKTDKFGNKILIDYSELISNFIRLLRIDISHSEKQEEAFINDIRRLFRETREYENGQELANRQKEET